MIPEFTVKFKDGVVDISFSENVPSELAVYIKEKLLELYIGCVMTPDTIRQIGDSANNMVQHLVNVGSLFKDISGNWQLKEKLIEWRQDD